MLRTFIVHCSHTYKWWRTVIQQTGNESRWSCTAAYSDFNGEQEWCNRHDVISVYNIQFKLVEGARLGSKNKVIWAHEERRHTNWHTVWLFQRNRRFHQWSMQWCMFNSQVCQPGKPITLYIIGLGQLSQDCEFTATLEKMLRDYLHTCLQRTNQLQLSPRTGTSNVTCTLNIQKARPYCCPKCLHTTETAVATTKRKAMEAEVVQVRVVTPGEWLPTQRHKYHDTSKIMQEDEKLQHSRPPTEPRTSEVQKVLCLLVEHCEFSQFAILFHCTKFKINVPMQWL